MTYQIIHKINGDLYLCCRTNFADNVVQTKTPQFMNMGFLTINALDKNGGLSNPATSIQRSMDGSHWSAPDHVFGEATDVGMSESR